MAGFDHHGILVLSFLLLALSLPVGNTNGHETALTTATMTLTSQHGRVLLQSTAENVFAKGVNVLAEQTKTVDSARAPLHDSIVTLKYAFPIFSRDGVSNSKELISGALDEIDLTNLDILGWVTVCAGGDDGDFCTLVVGYLFYIFVGVAVACVCGLVFSCFCCCRCCCGGCDSCGGRKAEIRDRTPCKRIVMGPLLVFFAAIVVAFSAIGFRTTVTSESDLDLVIDSFSGFIDTLSTYGTGISVLLLDAKSAAQNASDVVVPRLSNVRALTSTGAAVISSLTSLRADFFDMERVVSNDFRDKSGQSLVSCSGCKWYTDQLQTSLTAAKNAHAKIPNYEETWDPETIQRDIGAAVGSADSFLEDVADSLGEFSGFTQEIRNSARSGLNAGNTGLQAGFVLIWIMFVFILLGLCFSKLLWLVWIISFTWLILSIILFAIYMPLGKLWGDVCPLLPPNSIDDQLLVSKLPAELNRDGVFGRIVSECVSRRDGDLLAVFNISTEEVFTKSINVESLDTKNLLGVADELLVEVNKYADRILVLKSVDELFDLRSPRAVMASTFQRINSETSPHGLTYDESNIYSLNTTRFPSLVESKKSVIAKVEAFSRAESRFQTVQNSSRTLVASTKQMSHLGDKALVDIRSAIPLVADIADSFTERLTQASDSCAWVGNGLENFKNALCVNSLEEIDYLWFSCLIMFLALIPTTVLAAKGTKTFSRHPIVAPDDEALVNLTPKS